MIYYASYTFTAQNARIPWNVIVAEVIGIAWIKIGAVENEVARDFRGGSLSLVLPGAKNNKIRQRKPRLVVKEARKILVSARRCSALRRSNAYLVGSLAEQIHEFCPAKNERPDFLELHQRIVELEAFILSSAREHSDVGAVRESLAPEVLVQLRKDYSWWETRLEYRFAHRFLCGEVCLADYTLYERVQTLVQREIGMVQIDPAERVLFLGSGPFPISAILMHMGSRLQIDCIDRDATAVEVSRMVIETLNLSQAVRVVCGEGDECKVADYDLVVIACPGSKRSILRNVRKNCKMGVRVLCRTGVGLRALLYEEMTKYDLKGFRVADRRLAESEQTTSTWLLESSANMSYRQSQVECARASLG